MNKYMYDSSYMGIVQDILNNKDFMRLNEIPHHSTSRFYHSVKVSYYSYRISKFLKLKHDDVARAGLLHDFYYDLVNEQETIEEKVKLFTYKHPNDAVENSRIFGITKVQEDIIKGHMFPLDYKYPKSLEGLIVNLVDKCVSIKEFGVKFGKEFASGTNFIALFLVNYITRL